MDGHPFRDIQAQPAGPHVPRSLDPRLLRATAPRSRPISACPTASPTSSPTVRVRRKRSTFTASCSARAGGWPNRMPPWPCGRSLPRPRCRPTACSPPARFGGSAVTAGITPPCRPWNEAENYPYTAAERSRVADVRARALCGTGQAVMSKVSGACRRHQRGRNRHYHHRRGQAGPAAILQLLAEAARLGPANHAALAAD